MVLWLGSHMLEWVFGKKEAARTQTQGEGMYCRLAYFSLALAVCVCLCLCPFLFLLLENFLLAVGFYLSHLDLSIYIAA